MHESQCTYGLMDTFTVGGTVILHCYKYNIFLVSLYLLNLPYIDENDARNFAPNSKEIFH